MSNYKFKKEMNSCMIHDCNNDIPTNYPPIAKFCKKHTCKYSTDSYLDFTGGLFNNKKPNVYTSKNIDFGNKIIYTCYESKMSDDSTTCKYHTCEFEGCSNAITGNSTNCKDHEYKMTKKDELVMLCFIVLFFLCMFRFLYFI